MNSHFLKGLPHHQELKNWHEAGYVHCRRRGFALSKYSKCSKSYWYDKPRITRGLMYYKPSPRWRPMQICIMFSTDLIHTKSKKNDLDYFCCKHTLTWTSITDHLGHELHESGTKEHDAYVKKAMFIPQLEEIPLPRGGHHGQQSCQRHQNNNWKKFEVLGRKWRVPDWVDWQLVYKLEVHHHVLLCQCWVGGRHKTQQS